MRLVVLPLLAAFVLLAGCAQQTVEEKPEQDYSNSTAAQAFKAMLDGGKGINTLEAAYDATFENMKLSGKGYVKGEKSMEEVTVTVPYEGRDVSVTTKNYIEKDGVTTCRMAAENWSCQKVTPISDLTRPRQIAMYEALYTKKAFVFNETAEDRVVAGHACKRIAFSTRVGVLTTEEKYFLLALGGLSMAGSPESLANSLSDFKEAACVTAEGLSLESSTELDFSGGQKAVRMDTVTTDYTINGPIPDDIFVPPGQAG